MEVKRCPGWLKVWHEADQFKQTCNERRSKLAPPCDKDKEGKCVVLPLNRPIVTTTYAECAARDERI
jgi:hypothetical protein